MFKQGILSSVKEYMHNYSKQRYVEFRHPGRKASRTLWSSYKDNKITYETTKELLQWFSCICFISMTGIQDYEIWYNCR